jgi:gluconokinase
MGVSGCGKSEIGARLAARLGLQLVEGDAFHPVSNIEKMAAGIPLEDADRHGWLQVLKNKLSEAKVANAGIVLTCSALKRAYRDILRSGDADAVFVHLSGSRDVIANRMNARTGHFMPVSLLDSQFRDLEPPQPDERAIVLDVAAEPDAMIVQILRTAYPQGETT